MENMKLDKLDVSHTPAKSNKASIKFSSVHPVDLASKAPVLLSYKIGRI